MSNESIQDYKSLIKLSILEYYSYIEALTAIGKEKEAQYKKYGKR